MITFEQARKIVLDEWPDYDLADYGFEGDEHWFLILLPLTIGGRIPAVAKTTGAITWINENADIYTQERPVGEFPEAAG